MSYSGTVRSVEVFCLYFLISLECTLNFLVAKASAWRLWQKSHRLIEEKREHLAIDGLAQPLGYLIIYPRAARRGDLVVGYKHA